MIEILVGVRPGLLDYSIDPLGAFDIGKEYLDNSREKRTRQPLERLVSIARSLPMMVIHPDAL